MHQNNPNPQSSLAAFGDSIAKGLGARGKPYPVLVAEHLDARYIDLTGTGAKITDALSLREEAAGADVILIAFGITEAMIRPTDRSLRFFPKRWRRPGWMDPRPYYSHRRWKRICQMIESAVRWRIKVALIRLTGGMRWMSPQAYEHHLVELVDYLQNASNSPTIVIISRFGQDDRFFPASGPSFEEFLAINKRVAEAKETLFCDATHACRQWDDFLCDRFHPNRCGHKRIAEHIIASLSATSVMGRQGQTLKTSSTV
jgi:lysophospholipase L1-like esterase